METKSLNEFEFNEFVKIINEISGIDLTDKKNTLSLKLSKFLLEHGFDNFQNFLLKLKVNQKLKQETLDFVTIGETYFLRELEQLKEAIYYIKSLEKSVRVLSAPCSTGEEVYSLAILASQNYVKDIDILGIDINSNVIEKAKLGKYQGRTLQRLSEIEKNKFFTREDEIYTINKSELCPCKFELCNVFEDKFLRLGKFDIIVSRNMMIYFNYDSKLKLMEHFYKILNNKGRLYIGNADLAPDIELFKKVFSSKGVYYEKI
ncbi:methyltransferase domain-containing protein [Campylobacter sp. TTU-622]|uniref:CheR family methyltransferase n=1 Tax=unclassified Campylobacter TaxID=2593542 RepID=UPI001904C3BF|nr:MULTISPECIES: CheR family methyltransferase [unclassified Campylobacter]MBK1971187.1 methyltransferase domain-containing protein [Campylobacter sp. TTU_617]MBK1973564.1 methyltransferase domain-containing protein [Campylobacter sp. TTU-622]